MNTNARLRSIVVFAVCLLSTQLFVAQAQHSTPQGHLAPKPNSFDPSKADVISLHLHMTSAEAFAALEQRFGVKVKIAGCSGIGLGACAREQTSQLTPGKNFVSGLVMGTEQFELYLSFTESYPFDPTHPEILTSIDYRPVMTTTEDRKAFGEEAIKKYGKPSSPDTGPDTYSLLGGDWCAAPRLSTFGPSRYYCDLSVKGAPALSVRNGRVFVQDCSIAVDNHKRWDARKTVAPPPL